MQPGKILSVGLLCVLVGMSAHAFDNQNPFAQGTGRLSVSDVELAEVQVVALAAELRDQKSTRGRRTVYGRRSESSRAKSARRKRDGFRGQGSRKQRHGR